MHFCFQSLLLSQYSEADFEDMKTMVAAADVLRLSQSSGLDPFLTKSAVHNLNHLAEQIPDNGPSYTFSMFAGER